MAAGWLARGTEVVTALGQSPVRSRGLQRSFPAAAFSELRDISGAEALGVRQELRASYRLGPPSQVAPPRLGSPSASPNLICEMGIVTPAP